MSKIARLLTECVKFTQTQKCIFCSVGNQTLYHPPSMKLFADMHAPNLFAKILQSLERKDGRPISQKRHNKNLQRTVAILHILAYFRQVPWFSCWHKLQHWQCMHTRKVMTVSLVGKLMGWWAYSVPHPCIIKLNKRANYVQETSTRNE